MPGALEEGDNVNVHIKVALEITFETSLGGCPVALLPFTFLDEALLPTLSRITRKQDRLAGQYPGVPRRACLRKVEQLLAIGRHETK